MNLNGSPLEGEKAQKKKKVVFWAQTRTEGCNCFHSYSSDVQIFTGAEVACSFNPAT